MQVIGARWIAVGMLGAVLGAGCATPAPEPDEEVRLGSGVTDEPCPGAADQTRGCIYLGVLADLTDGPFGPLGVEVVSGVRDFWRQVNDAGGIGKFDVDVDTYLRDTGYDPQAHREAFDEIGQDVVGLALSFGTPTTEALAPTLAAQSMVTVPFSWWSGLDDPPVGDVLLRSGASYCAATRLTLDWLSDGAQPPDSVLVVGYPGAYAGDADDGARSWAAATDGHHLGTIETEPSGVGTPREALAFILDEEPDVVVLAVGPPRAADLVGAAVVGGYRGRFVGLMPTWDPALLQTDAAGALRASFLYVTPWEGFEGGSDAHAAMRAGADGQTPGNDGYAAGWISSYPLLEVLHAAHDEGRLTRAGLRTVAEGLEVSYDGALPVHTLGESSPDEQATVVISQPDAAAPTGLRVIETWAPPAAATSDCAP